MSSLKALLMSRQLTSDEANAIVQGLAHDDIGIVEPMSVYDHKNGVLRNPITFAEKCKELEDLVVSKKAGCIRDGEAADRVHGDGDAQHRGWSGAGHRNKRDAGHHKSSRSQ